MVVVQLAKVVSDFAIGDVVCTNCAIGDLIDDGLKRPSSLTMDIVDVAGQKTEKRGQFFRAVSFVDFGGEKGGRKEGRKFVELSNAQLISLVALLRVLLSSKTPECWHFECIKELNY
eukprot:scaffold14308_cov126-Skeletonema_menzelii.AAC.1